MIRNISNFIATIILSILLSLILPWYAVMVAAFITGMFINLKGIWVFLIPFLAVMLLWISHAYILGNANDFILAKKIAVLLPLGGYSIVLILVTGLIGGIAAGVAGILGKQVSVVAD